MASLTGGNCQLSKALWLLSSPVSSVNEEASGEETVARPAAAAPRPPGWWLWAVRRGLQPEPPSTGRWGCRGQLSPS